MVLESCFTSSFSCQKLLLELFLSEVEMPRALQPWNKNGRCWALCSHDWNERMVPKNIVEYNVSFLRTLGIRVGCNLGYCQSVALA